VSILWKSYTLLKVIVIYMLHVKSVYYASVFSRFQAQINFEDCVRNGLMYKLGTSAMSSEKRDPFPIFRIS